MKKMKLHIVLDLVIGWMLICSAVYFGIVRNFLFLVFVLPLFIWYAVRTLKWLKIVFALMFTNPQVVKTKGYRYSYRERAYQLIPNTALRYSVLLFDDVALKGEYVFMGDSIFRHGEKLEIIYYPRAKYIKSIVRLQDDV